MANAPMIVDLKEYFSTSESQDKMLVAAQQFADEHCHIFDIESETHKLEYTELHRKYQERFEQHLEEFLTDRGHDKATFETQIHAACAEEPQITQLVQWILLLQEYEIFVQFMVERKRGALRMAEMQAGRF
jgi:hypothetical protein